MDYFLTLTSWLSGSGGTSPPVHSGVAVLSSCSYTWRVKALIIPFSIFKLMSGRQAPASRSARRNKTNKKRRRSSCGGGAISVGGSSVQSLVHDDDEG